MASYPKPVDRFIKIVRRLPGIKDVGVGLRSLDGIEIDDLGLHGEFADLPHVALRRSNGGLAHEALAYAEIWFEQSRAGWIALEFLAWWGRPELNLVSFWRQREWSELDRFASPRLVASLKFYLEFFIVEPSDDATRIAAKIGEYAEDLNESIDLYAEAIRKPARPENAG